MTKEETIKIMAMLNAFYAGGKNDPKMQATAWHLVLQKYDYSVAQEAIVMFAENDTREYATFPAVGNIVEGIKQVQADKDHSVRCVLYNIQMGQSYESLIAGKDLITADEFYQWQRIDAEEFAADIEKYEKVLKHRRDYGTDEEGPILISNEKMLPMKR